MTKYDYDSNGVARSHLPAKATVDYKQLFEKFANWTLPGLQFFLQESEGDDRIPGSRRLDTLREQHDAARICR